MGNSQEIQNEVLREPLQLLIRWLRETSKASTLGDLLDILSEERALPPDVQAAWDNLHSTPLQDLVGPGAKSTILHCLEALESALSHERDAYVFWDRISLSPSTLDEIGAQLGITRQRIQQLQAKAQDCVSVAMASCECDGFRWRAWRLAQRLGRMAPAEAEWVQSEIDDALAGVPAEWRDRLQTLLLWKAGPYRPDSAGWLCRGPALKAEEITRGGIADDQAIDLNQVHARLMKAGVVDDAHKPWIQRHLPLRVIAERTYFWAGSITDKAAIWLSAHGVPMTTDEIVDAIGEGHSVRATRSRLLNDSRFIRVDQHKIGLRLWNMDEYTGIVDAIAEELEGRGGEAELADVVAAVATAYSISRGSVASLAAAPRFVMEDGRIRLRRPDEPYQPRRGVTDEAGCYLASEDVCILRLRVSPDLLRGSGCSIPEGLGAWLGVLPPGRRVYMFGQQGHVPITWPDSAVQGPSIGSLRRVADALGAEADDFLMIEFNRTTSAAQVELLRDETLANANGIERLALLTGLALSADSVEEQIASAIGSSDVAGVRNQLRHRGEEQLLASLAKNAPSDLDTALDRLRDIF